jgi:nucleoside-diphosphate kinase
MSSERTFIAVKPDGVQRGLVGEIIARFERKGFKLVALKMLQPSTEQAQGHYADLSSKPFFNALVEYFSSGPIVGMVWEGKNVVKSGRMLLGATNPADSLPGTIRGDYAVDVGRNVCHGSDAVESAQREIAFWFKPEELVSWTSHSTNQIYE